VQGGILQTIALVFAANARLHGVSYAGWPDASAFHFCNRVNFVGRKRPGFLGFSTALDVPNPNIWLDTLPADTSSARLVVLPRNDPNISDLTSVGFAGGGPVFLAQISASTPEAWYGDWHVTNQTAADQRIWSVTYRNLANAGAGMQPGAHREVRDALEKALDDAIAFNNAHDMGFEHMFVAAKNALSDAAPLDGYYASDLVPEKLLSLTDRQLFAGAAKAWVFGAMGSWNDVWFDGDDQKVYEELSDRLFSSIVRGLVIATNASASA